MTGSVGKTTTTHLLAAPLATHGPVAPDPSGGGRSVAKRLARSVVGASRRHRDCVLEIQASREHSIDQGVWFTEPEVGVVTRSGAALLERLPLAHDGVDVRCWLQSCELRRWCEDCEFLAQERHEAS